MSSLKNYLIQLFFACYACNVFGQLENSKWFFGHNAGLDFATSPPTQISSMGNIGSASVGATLCDNAGNLLFYTNGGDIFNSTHALMTNGMGLGGVIALAAVKQPGTTNIYYLFTVGNNNTWLKYSVIDMNLAAGLGSVTVLNNNVYQTFVPASVKLVSARHCNGKDVWIISHDFNSNQFRSFLLSSAGLNTVAVISAVGPNLNTPGAASGELQISPNGRLLAMAQGSNSVPSSLGTAGFYLFDFDAATGLVSNARQIDQQERSGSMEFSEDGKKLYGSGVNSVPGYSTVIYQWDLCAGSTQAITNSKFTYTINDYSGGGLRRAINGKIYTVYQPTFPLPTTYSIAVINNPNAAGAAMNFVVNGQSTGTNMPNGNLPNFINPYVKPVISFTPSQNCQHITFNGPVAPTIPGGCGINVYPINSYLWDFGEPSSGAANSSTAASPAHSYASTGTYSVKLIVYSNCTNDTIVQSVQVNNLAPTISVSGPSVICFGETRNYTVTGASSYSWSGSSSTNSVVALSPMASTLYSVTGSANGCTATKTFSVKVNDCVGLTELARNKVLALYPNPFNDRLMVEMEDAMPYAIYSIDGKLVMQGQLVKGTNALNTEALKLGLYIVACGENRNIVRYRLVKAEWVH